MAVRYDTRDVPVPTTRMGGIGTTIKRAKTLTRPERSVAAPPLINPQGIVPAPTGVVVDSGGFDPWTFFSRVLTFWAPAVVLKSLGLKDKVTRQAWREKIALCFLIAVACTVVGFATVGLQKVLCPDTQTLSTSQFVSLGATPGTLGIAGWGYNVTNSKSTDSENFISLSAATPGQDITTLFTRSAADFSECTSLSFRVAVDEPCSGSNSCPLGNLNSSSTFSDLNLVNMSLSIGYDWDQVYNLTNFIVLDGHVLNLQPYFNLHNNAITGDDVDLALRALISTNSRDGTRLFVNKANLKAAIPCMVQRYGAGNIDKITPGCFVSQLVLYAGLIVILGLVLIRFVMACIFNWLLSERLAGNPDSTILNRSAISPAVMPEGANISIDNRTGTAPWAGPGGTKKITKANNKSARSINTASSVTLASQQDAQPIMSLAQIGAELFAVCLVTCYSEGEESLRTTLDSISTTTYSDARKLLFIVADGMITGAGEKRSTPDICVGLLEADPRFGNPMPMSYEAVGSGSKAQNRAMVYAGHYSALIFPLSIWAHAERVYTYVFQPSLVHGRRLSSS